MFKECRLTHLVRELDPRSSPAMTDVCFSIADPQAICLFGQAKVLELLACRCPRLRYLRKRSSFCCVTCRFRLTHTQWTSCHCNAFLGRDDFSWLAPAAGSKSYHRRTFLIWTCLVECRPSPKRLCFVSRVSSKDGRSWTSSWSPSDLLGSCWCSKVR